MKDIFKIGMMGIVAAILATFFKKERAEISTILGIITGVVIFFYIISQLSVVTDFLSSILAQIQMEETYYFQLVKMLGIAYVAEFASSICKDAGQQSSACMIELFAKLSIVTLSIPGLLFLVETLEMFL